MFSARLDAIGISESLNLSSNTSSIHQLFRHCFLKVSCILNQSDSVTTFHSRLKEVRTQAKRGFQIHKRKKSAGNIFKISSPFRSEACSAYLQNSFATATNSTIFLEYTGSDFLSICFHQTDNKFRHFSVFWSYIRIKGISHLRTQVFS